VFLPLPLPRPPRVAVVGGWLFTLGSKEYFFASRQRSFRTVFCIVNSTTRPPRQLLHDFFPLNYITMVLKADVDTLINTKTNKSSTSIAIRPGCNHNGANSTHWHRRHAFRRLVASVTLFLFGFQVVLTSITQDAYPSYIQYHHGPLIYKPPWPPPPPINTTFKSATADTTEKDGPMAHSAYALSPVIDEAMRKQCSTEIFSHDPTDKFSRDLGLRHLIRFRVRPSSPSQPPNPDITDRS